MIDRWLQHALGEDLGRPFVHILFGARQTGKSTLLSHLVPAPSLHYNLADPESGAASWQIRVRFDVNARLSPPAPNRTWCWSTRPRRSPRCSMRFPDQRPPVWHEDEAVLAYLESLGRPPDNVASFRQELQVPKDLLVPTPHNTVRTITWGCPRPLRRRRRSRGRAPATGERRVGDRWHGPERWAAVGSWPQRLASGDHVAATDGGVGRVGGALQRGQGQAVDGAQVAAAHFEDRFLSVVVERIGVGAGEGRFRSAGATPARAACSRFPGCRTCST